jgi:hypothetical protein
VRIFLQANLLTGGGLAAFVVHNRLAHEAFACVLVAPVPAIPGLMSISCNQPAALGPPVGQHSGATYITIN